MISSFYKFFGEQSDQKIGFCNAKTWLASNLFTHANDSLPKCALVGFFGTIFSA
jgi:hypothetical protein